jgi:hypothetical protein
MFRKNISHPSSGSNNPSKETSVKADGKQRLVSFLGYSSALKMEAKCSSETSVDFQLTMLCYIPEDNHRCKNLKSYKEPSVRPGCIAQGIS